MKRSRLIGLQWCVCWLSCFSLVSAIGSIEQVIAAPPVPSIPLLCPPRDLLSPLKKFSAIPTIPVPGKEALDKLVLNYAAVGKLDEVLSIVESRVSSPYLKELALQKIAIAYASIGKSDEAFSIVERRINDLYSKVDVLTEIAKYQPSSAEKTLERALKIAQQIKGEKPSFLFRKIAVEYAALGKLPQALQLVQPLSSNQEVISEIITRSLQVRQDKTAFDLISILPKYFQQELYKDRQEAALQIVLEQAIKDNRGAELLPQVLAFSDDCLRQELVKSIVFSPDEKHKNRFSVIIPLAQSIQEEYLKNSTLNYIVLDLLGDNQPEKAVQLGMAVPKSKATDIFLNIGYYYINKENPDKALQYLDQARAFGADIKSVGKLLLDIISQYAKSGQQEKATQLLKLAEQITEVVVAERSRQVLPPVVTGIKFRPESTPSLLSKTFATRMCPSRTTFTPELTELSLPYVSAEEILRELAVTYAAVGKIDQAFSIVERKIKQPSSKAIALTGIAKYQPSSAAEKTLEKVAQIVQRIKDEKPSLLLRKMAVEYAALGKLPQALKLVQPLSSNQEVIPEILTRSLQARQDKTAFDLIAALPKYFKQGLYDRQVSALQLVLEQAIKNDRGAELLPQVLASSNDCLRQELVKSIAFLSEDKNKNRFSVIIPLAQSIQTKDLKDSALNDIASALLRDNQPEATLQLAMKAPKSTATKILLKIGYYYVNKENPDKALQYLDQARASGADTKSVGELLLDIISQYAKSGQKEKATQLLKLAVEIIL